MTWTGGCQCGSVRYEFAGEPLALYVCHCIECRRQSASAFGMSLAVPRAGFRLNLEANAAVSWLVTDNAKVALGYRVDAYFDVYDMSGPFDDRDQGDRIIHGPFIKLTVGGGG